MKIEIRFQKFELSENMTSQVINRVRFTVNRFTDVSGHLQVNFSDTNEPEVGLDKHCLLPVNPVCLRKIMANGERVDLRSALN